MVGSPHSNDCGRLQWNRKGICSIREWRGSQASWQSHRYLFPRAIGTKSPAAATKGWTATSTSKRAIPVSPISSSQHQWLARQNALPPTTLGPPEPICLGGIHGLNLIGIGTNPRWWWQCNNCEFHNIYIHTPNSHFTTCWLYTMGYENDFASNMDCLRYWKQGEFAMINFLGP